jgi:signal transduction histidine kinase
MLIRTNERTCVRDTTNHALLTTDLHALQRARARRATYTQTQALQTTVSSLQEELAELRAAIAALQAK